MKPFSEQINISRRKMLTGLIALGVAPKLIADIAKISTETTQEFWISAQKTRGNIYGVSWAKNDVKNSANIQTRLTGFQGHGIAQHPLRSSNVVMFARLPGTQMIEVNLITGDLVNTIQCDKNRHQLGHGCFSFDGDLLFTTEAEISSGKGKLVVRDANNYQLLDEFDSGGIGPHEIKLMPDNKTLVIANGGILTHPETGKKLNLDTMQSNLSYLDLKNGQILEQVILAEQKSSIRHLDIAADGTVALAIQMQRKAAGHNNIVPLTAIHQRGSQIELLKTPEPIAHKMMDYVGSVVINNKTRLAGFSSAKGNLVTFWNIDDKSFAGYYELNDVNGITCTANQKYFLISSFAGQLRFIDAVTLKEKTKARIKTRGVYWDNHLVSIVI